MAKKWYIKQPNSSKLVAGDTLYYMEGRTINTWTTELTKARSFKTKTEAIAFIDDALHRGEVYGE